MVERYCTNYDSSWSRQYIFEVTCSLENLVCPALFNTLHLQAAHKEEGRNRLTHFVHRGFNPLHWMSLQLLQHTKDCKHQNNTPAKGQLSKTGYCWYFCSLYLHVVLCKSPHFYDPPSFRGSQITLQLTREAPHSALIKRVQKIKAHFNTQTSEGKIHNG